MTHLKKGETAPTFTLNNQNEEEICLEQFRGEKAVVLYFYPKAMTPGCTVQACGLRDHKNLFTSKDAVILGISPDSPSRLNKFMQRDQLNYDLLSDPDHHVADAYGVWGQKTFMGKKFDGILRTTFIIGKNGKILHIMNKIKTKTHHNDVLSILNT